MPWHVKCSWPNLTCASCSQCLPGTCDIESCPHTKVWGGSSENHCQTSTCAGCTTCHTGADAIFVLSANRARGLSICAFEKTGTTSLFHWLYRAVYGKSFAIPHDHAYYVQDSSRWTPRLPTVPIGLPSGINAEVIYIVRDPLDRYVSAFHSKFMCGTHAEDGVDVMDRDRFVPTLVQLAKQPINFNRHGQICLTWDEFVACLIAVHEDGNAAQLNTHIRPQMGVPQCGEGGSRLTVTQFGQITLRLVQEYNLHSTAVWPQEKLHSSPTSITPVDKLALCPIVHAEYIFIGAEETFVHQCLPSPPFLPPRRPPALPPHVPLPDIPLPSSPSPPPPLAPLSQPLCSPQPSPPPPPLASPMLPLVSVWPSHLPSDAPTTPPTHPKTASGVSTESVLVAHINDQPAPQAPPPGALVALSAGVAWTVLLSLFAVCLCALIVGIFQCGMWAQFIRSVGIGRQHGHRVESSANPVNDLDGINDLDNDVPPNEERNSRLAMIIGGRHKRRVQAHDSISAL